MKYWIGLCCMGVAWFTQTAGAVNKQIAITFDDLPGWQPTPLTRQEVITQISKALLEAHAPATGFLIGKLSTESPAHLQAIHTWAKAGFALGNHTWSHRRYSQVSSKDFIHEIQRTEALIEPLRKEFGPWPRSFRFPMLNQGGSPKKELAINQYLQRTQTLLAHVSIDDSDWAFAQEYAKLASDTARTRLADLYLEHIKDCVSFAETASDSIFSGQIPQILLLHINALNARMTPLLLSWLRKQGYEFISLPQALSHPVYAPNQHRIAYLPSDNFFGHMAHILGKNMPSGPDRTTYRYFEYYWKPKIRDVMLH